MPQFFYNNNRYLLEQEKKYKRFFISNLLKALAVFLFAGILGYVVINTGLSTSFKLGAFMFIATVALVVGSIFLYLYSKHELRWVKYKSGISGESRVYKELAKLPADYKVYCGGKLTYGDLDFGVLKGDTFFNLEVKNHKGRISFNGIALLKNGRPFWETDPVKEVLRNEKDLKHKFYNNLEIKKIVSVVVFANKKAWVQDYKLGQNLYVTHVSGLIKFLESYF
ncbi:MAG: NERD domain-containing protein [Candidatus Doudnabacteria bacterium]|nr:NERD domain-containing protein [Candidatus Doudnabacteria bacterium]